MAKNDWTFQTNQKKPLAGWKGSDEPEKSVGRSIRPKSDQIRLDYDKLGSEHDCMQMLEHLQIVKHFRDNGITIGGVVPCKRAKRENGIPTKSVVLELTNGQDVTLKAKSDGTVFQVKVGSTVLPITRVYSVKGAVEEISDYVKQAESKAAARKEKLEKTGGATQKKEKKPRTQPKTLKKQTEEAKQALEEEKKQAASSVESKKHAEATVSNMRTQIADLKKQLQDAESERSRLVSKYVSLGGDKSKIKDL